MIKLVLFILLNFISYNAYGDSFTLNCTMNSYGNTTNVNVAKSWVNPVSKFVINGEEATYHYSGKSLSGSAQDKGDRLKIYFDRTVSMKSGAGTKKVKANMIIDYFYESKKIAADWKFVGFKDLGTVWGVCEKD